MARRSSGAASCRHRRGFRRPCAPPGSARARVQPAPHGLRSPSRSRCRHHAWLELRLSLPEMCEDRKSTRLNSSHEWISYAVFCLKKKKKKQKAEEKKKRNKKHTAQRR